MARGKIAKVIRPVSKKLSVPEDVVARVDLELWSELEGRVPHGAWSELIERLLREHIAKLDGRLRKLGQEQATARHLIEAAGSTGPTDQS